MDKKFAHLQQPQNVGIRSGQIMNQGAQPNPSRKKQSTISANEFDEAKETLDSRCPQ
jgi:hypothetical protein